MDELKKELSKLIPDLGHLAGIYQGPWGVIVEVNCPITNKSGKIVVRPNEQGSFSFVGGPSAFNGYHIDGQAESFEKIIDVIKFTQNLLKYQPDVYELEEVIIPDDMSDHWCLTQNKPNFKKYANFV